MLDIFFTLGLLIIILLVLYFTGINIITFTKTSSKDSIIIAPIIGLAFITILAQNLVYLDIKLKYSSWIVLVVILILFLINLIRKQYIPLSINPLLTISLLITIVTQSYPIFLSSSSDYIGNGTRDQWNYSATSQFLVDYKFSTSDIKYTPYLPIGILWKHDRIGQSIIQGLFSTITFQNTKTLYGITSLIGIFLLCLTLWYIGIKTRLNTINCFWLSTIGSTLPGIAYLNITNNQLSHIISLPFLLIWPIILQTLIFKPKVKNMFLASLLLAAANSIYTETTLIYLLIALIMIVFNFINKKSNKPTLSAIFVIFAIAIAFVINPFFLNSFFKIFISRSAVPNIYYPAHALTINGVYKLYSNIDFRKYTVLSNELFLLVTLLGYSGLFFSIFTSTNLFSFGFIFLASIPILILGLTQPFPYQFYKILISISPLLIYGLIIFKYEFSKKLPNFWVNITLNLLMFLIFIVTSFSTIKTGKESYIATQMFRLPQVKEILNKLEKSNGKNYLVVTDNKELGSWLSYHGRYNNVYLLKDFYGAGWDMKPAFNLPFLDLNSIDKNQIKVINLSSFKTTSPELNQTIGVIVDNEEYGNSRNYLDEPAFLKKQINLNLWAKKSIPITLNFTASIESAASATIQIGNESLGYKSFLINKKINTITFPITPLLGTQKLIIKNNSDIIITLTNFFVSNI